MPKYKRVRTKHQEPRDQSVTHPGRGGSQKVSGDWPGRGEPRKADRGPLEARQALRGEAGGRLPVPGWASGGAGVRPPPQSAALPLSPGQSHQEGQRLAGAGITTGQGRKTGPKEREEPVKAEEEKREKLSDSELELKNDEEGALCRRTTWPSF